MCTWVITKSPEILLETPAVLEAHVLSQEPGLRGGTRILRET